MERGAKGLTKQENIVIQVKCLTVQRQRANTVVNESYEIVIEAAASSYERGQLNAVREGETPGGLVGRPGVLN